MSESALQVVVNVLSCYPEHVKVEGLSGNAVLVPRSRIPGTIGAPGLFRVTVPQSVLARYGIGI